MYDLCVNPYPFIIIYYFRPTVGRKEKLEKVRADLSAASVKRTKSKRFMTPERKKKLRV